jgi:outer membrane protein OmpA-like peptidoglycan-associated protein
VHPLTFQRSSGSEQPLVRDRVTQWLGAQVHLVGPLSLSAQLPVTLTTGGDLTNLPPSYQGPTEVSGGLADVRITPRLSLLRQEGAGIDLAMQMSLEFPTSNAQSLSSDGSVHAEGLIALGANLGSIPAGNLDLLANAYVRSRPVRDFLEVKSGTEAGLRGGLAWIIAPVHAFVPRRVYTELEGSTYLRAGFAAGSAPAEWRLGGTLCPVGDLAIDVAGGGALTDGVGAPRARFLFGLGWSPAACGQRAVALPAPAPQPVIIQVPAPEPVAKALPPPAPPVVIDRDGDGIPDADDACPEQAGPAENHGCPPGVPWRVIVSATSLEILDRVHFASGKALIEPRSYALLDQVAAVIQSHPALLLIQVEGHTDDRGGSSYNLLLSQQRATAVADYLVSRGVSRDRLVARGFGPTHPVGTNGTAEGRAANRRVAFTVLKTQAREIDAQRPPDS